MNLKKHLNWLFLGTILISFSITGCQTAPKEVVKPEITTIDKQESFTLKQQFTPADTATYRIVIETEKTAKLEGKLDPKINFKGGHTGNRLEMTYTQQIQSVDTQGNATAKITIDKLKYSEKIKDNFVLEFDSSKTVLPRPVMADLVGESYIIRILPTGKVMDVSGLEQLRTKVMGPSTPHQVAAEIISGDAIKERHTAPFLPEGDKAQFSKGDKWSSNKTYYFSLMGSKSYEKEYVVKDIQNTADGKIAIIEMNGIPSSASEDQRESHPGVPDLSQKFDNIETYHGTTEFDLSKGSIKKCYEKLTSEWIAVDMPKEEKEPVVLKMGVSRIYDLERID